MKDAVKIQTKTVIEATARHFGIPIDTLFEHKTRTRDVSYARHIAMYIARSLTYLSYRNMGKDFGFTHMSTVYGCKQIEKILSLETTKRDIAAITKALK